MRTTAPGPLNHRPLKAFETKWGGDAVRPLDRLAVHDIAAAMANRRIGRRSAWPAEKRRQLLA